MTAEQRQPVEAYRLIEDEQVQAVLRHSAHDDPDSPAAAYDLGRVHAFGRAAALVKAATDRAVDGADTEETP